MVATLATKNARTGSSKRVRIENLNFTFASKTTSRRDSRLRNTASQGLAIILTVFPPKKEIKTNSIRAQVDLDYGSSKAMAVPAGELPLADSKVKRPATSAVGCSYTAPDEPLRAPPWTAGNSIATSITLAAKVFYLGLGRFESSRTA